MASLFVVATPIGNLEDLSPRAERALRESAAVAAESINRTRKLLSHLGISGKKLISCRESNRDWAAGQVAELLGQGLDVALVSDSGTPGVSDPGSVVVEKAAEAGHRVSPVPGPSALASALSVSGFAGTPSVFLGFCPTKTGARKKLLERAAATGWPVVLFEGPHRLAKTARDLLEVFGNRRVVLARELSKLNEEVAHLSLARLAELAGQGGDKARGEITLVVEGGEPLETGGPDLDELLREGLAKNGERPAKLAARVAKQMGMTKDEVYRRLLGLKQ